jgi:predicted DNA binding CopG/RHH family protein
MKAKQKLSFEEERQDSFSKEQLKDITKIAVNTASPLNERLKNYIQSVGNPYQFLVKGTPVRVVFGKDATTPTFEMSMENIVKKHIG